MGEILNAAELSVSAGIFASKCCGTMPLVKEYGNELKALAKVNVTVNGLLADTCTSCQFSLKGESVFGF